LGVSYQICVERYSEVAQRKYGSGRVYMTIWHGHMPPPRDEVGFTDWLLNLCRRKGVLLPGIFRLSRSQDYGELRGWKGVGTILATDDHSPLVVKNAYSGVRGIPGAPVYDDFWFKRPDLEDGFGRFKTIPGFVAIT